MKINNMKYFYILCMICCVFGCENQEKTKQIKSDIDRTTLRSTHYLTTIVHDEHLFIISKSGYFIHHMDCPCLIIKFEEKMEPKVELPKGNILDLIKGNRP